MAVCFPIVHMCNVMEDFVEK